MIEEDDNDVYTTRGDVQDFATITEDDDFFCVHGICLEFFYNRDSDNVPVTVWNVQYFAAIVVDDKKILL